MNTQKAIVHYKGRQRELDFDLIDDLVQLRLATKLRFDNLPSDYEIQLEDPHGNTITNQEIRLLKQFGRKDVNLYICDHKDDELQLESIASDLSNIEILGSKNGKNIKDQKVLLRNSRESFEKQQVIKQGKEQISYPQVIERPIRQQGDEVLNEDVQCNGCFQFPIKGHIYKCIVCQDYDLCSKCEASMHHFHPFLKVTRKTQYPTHLKVTFSKKSKRHMEKMEEMDRINEQRSKKLKYHKEVADYRVIDPSTLRSEKICAKNFVSEIIGSV